MCLPFTTIVLEKQQEDQTIQTVTYGAPVAKLNSEQGLRYRSAYDPVSMLDFGSKTINQGTHDLLDNHGYDGYEGYASNTINADGSQILIE